MLLPPHRTRTSSSRILRYHPEKMACGSLEQVNRLPRCIPVVLVSGFHEHQVARLAAAPFARKLLKPIEPERLCKEIAEVLRPAV